MTSWKLQGRIAQQIATVVSDSMVDPVALIERIGEDPKTFFEHGNFRGFDFRGSNLSGVSFKGADVSELTCYPDQLRQIQASAPQRIDNPNIQERSAAMSGSPKGPSKSDHWFDWLQQDLSLTERELTRQLVEYRERASDSARRAAYPHRRTIQNFANTRSIRARTLDFILSFISDVYPDRSTRFKEEAAGKIQKNVRSHRMVAVETLDREAYIRSDYWKIQNENLYTPILGWHYIVRIRDGKEVVADVMYIGRSEKSLPALDAYWMRTSYTGSEIYRGNLFPSDSALMGTFLSQEPERILKAININVTYSLRRTEDPELGVGLVSGQSPTRDTIFSYPVLFVKHSVESGETLTEAQFKHIALKKLDAFNPEKNQEIRQILERNGQIIISRSLEF